MTPRPAHRKAGQRLLKLLQGQAHVVYPPVRRFKIRTGAEIMAQPSPEYQVQGIVPRGSFVVLYGPPGTIKTFAALAMALHITNESKWLGHPCRRGVALYVAAEGQGALGLRLRAWELGHRKQSAESLLVVTDPPNLLSTDDVDALLAELRVLKQKPDVIIFDTLAQTMVGGDENSARDMGMYIAAANRIRAEFGCTVVAVHHTGKDKGAERGSSALRGAADVMIKTSAVGQPRNRFVITCDKMKDGASFDRIYVGLVPADVAPGQSSCYLVRAEGPLYAADPNLSPSDRRAMAALRKGAKGAEAGWVARDAWIKLSELNGSTFKHASERLVKAKLVERSKEGRKTRYRPVDRNRGRGSKGAGNGPAASQAPGRTEGE
ncbi:MAG: AAA family ATPase [Sedimentisphaerales bacterium]|nr:AAA family ATPase [Sedimentisphaerales bacterium]